MALDWHGRLADVYADRYGEPLVADAEWCEPLGNIVEASVACDPSYEHEFDDSDEIVTRTADVIATITHGVQRAQMMRATTAGRRAAGGA